MQPMKVYAQIAGVAVMILLGLIPAWAASGSLSGVVRDSAGVPQIGAEVELLRSDLSVVTSVYTNAEGKFLIASILPGRYALKAMGTSFLPSLREDVRIRGGQTVVNLTLNTLYEVMQWLPAEPRSSTAKNDDWQWTLRSAADRPLLRWLEDGPLVVVSDGRGKSPRLKARLMATGQVGTFGESGERITTTIEDTPANSRELLAEVDFAPDSNGAIESMLGFKQDLGFAGSVKSVAAVAVHPELKGVGNSGVEQAAVESSESMRLGDMVEVEVGSNESMVRTSDGVMTRGLPFADAGYHTDDSTTIRYRFATQMPDENQADGAMPRLGVRSGKIAMEHGIHNEIGVERRAGNTEMAVKVYADRIQNPMLEARAKWANGSGASDAGVLYDPMSGLARVSGNDYSSTGVEADVERSLPGATVVRASYATGRALVMPALPQGVFQQVMTAARARNAQTYSIALSGTLDGSGTRWRASYRWQPEETVTEVAPFAIEALAPYLNLHLCQTVHESRDGGSRIEALLEVQNLLAEGYHPYLLSDGSTLIFAQNQRALRAGLAFTF
jgi:hypothetical protein